MGPVPLPARFPGAGSWVMPDAGSDQALAAGTPFCACTRYQTFAPFGTLVSVMVVPAVVVQSTKWTPSVERWMANEVALAGAFQLSWSCPTPAWATESTGSASGVTTLTSVEY